MPKALRRGEAGTRCRRRCGRDRRHSGGFLLRAMPPSWHPVPACVRYGILQAKPFSLAATENRIGCGPRCRNGRSRRKHSLLPQRKLESDTDLVAATALQAKPFSSAARKIRIGRGPRSRYDHCRRAILSCSSDDAASIPKSEREIKNRCMQQAIFSTRSLDESLWR